VDEEKGQDQEEQESKEKDWDLSRCLPILLFLLPFFLLMHLVLRPRQSSDSLQAVAEDHRGLAPARSLDFRLTRAAGTMWGYANCSLLSG